MQRLLLGSGGLGTAAKLSAWKAELDDFLGSARDVLFVPYAGHDPEAYLKRLTEIDFHAGRATSSIHRAADPVAAVREAACISVGGGNTFRLLARAQNEGLLPAIRARVAAGVPYVGISAGSNLACPTIKTTNDMPIATPAGLDALGLVRFQINPHFFGGAIHYYGDQGLEKYAGETREDRIREFHEMNAAPVLGMLEGTILRVEGERMTIKGVGGAKLFERGRPPRWLAVGDALSLIA